MTALVDVKLFFVLIKYCIASIGFTPWGFSISDEASTEASIYKYCENLFHSESMTNVWVTFSVLLYHTIF